MKQVVRKRVRDANSDIIKEDSIYTLLLDMNNIMKIHSVNHTYNGMEQDYGIVLGTLRTISNMLRVKDFNFVYACYDGNQSGQLRYQYYPDYKANRDKHYTSSTNQTEYDRKIAEYCKKVIAYHKGKKHEVKRNETEEEDFNRQRQLIQDILEELFIRQVMFDEVEGDDIIAYYVKHKKENEKVVIFSGDRDLTQLISDTVTVYIPSLKKYVTPQNSVELLGYTYKNVVLKKIICGDASDNIKGIKGVGETTLMKLFPKIKTEKTTLNEVLSLSNELLVDRAKNGKKPLKSLENIVKRITDGCQGEHIYEVNEKIIDLSHPLMTEIAEKSMELLMYSPIDPSDRDIKNVYEIIEKNDMQELLNENSFGNLFGIFEGIKKREINFFKSCS